MCVLVSLACGTVGAKVIYVDDSAVGADNGTSWTDAYVDMQVALAGAVATDEIQVAQGDYKTTIGTDRNVSFELKNGVTVYGGFAGVGEPDPSARDISLYETILSGDLGTSGDAADNSYTVVNGSGTDYSAVLDGFTVMGGNADDSDPDADDMAPVNSGGGMYNNGGNPTVRHCVFKDNFANQGGAGMMNYSSSPVVIDCAFVNNEVTNGSGGGIINYISNALIQDCRFTGNQADSGGGGMYNIMGGLTIVNCAFQGNTAFSGGAVYEVLCANVRMINCMFSGNKSDQVAGAAGFQESDTVLTNCTFSNNSAPLGGGVVVAHSTTRIPTVVNCILWDNPGGEIVSISANFPSVTYSNVKGGFPGGGNTASDPMFIDPDGPDNTIGTMDDNLRLQRSSICVDFGNNEAVPADTFDMDGDGNIVEPVPLDADRNPRFLDDPAKPDMGYAGSTGLPVVDRGAYEWHFPCDMYVDNAVNLLDFAVLADHWLDNTCGYCGGADLTGDGGVGPDDLSIFSQHWLETY